MLWSMACTSMPPSEEEDIHYPFFSSAPNVRLYGIDRDPIALEAAKND